jgi:hypothetical protein
MNTAPAFLSWAFAVAPVPPSDTDAPVAYAAPVIAADEYTTRAGHRTRWASAKYVLPDGKIAEVFIVADETASGEATISVDGEALVSTSYDPTTGVTSWASTEPGAGELVIAAMTAIADRGGDELLDAFTPDEPEAFPCSDYGRKVVRAAKYVWGMTLAASTSFCCAGTGVFGCGGCLAAGWGLGEAGAEALDGYCD